MKNPQTRADDILRCARTLIIRGGYNSFSYADISNVVGIRNASIHHHFPSKSDLVCKLVEQYRHGARERLLELPAGTLESGEKPVVTAERELREEIGMRPGRTEPLGGFYVAPSYATEYIHLFICSDLTPDPLPADEDEDITTTRLTRKEALAAIDEGRIIDAKSIVGILRWDRLTNSQQT